ncbi:MAG: hypothetical protein JWO67_6382 [Streptosporangiaceae bacterium]|nr:hypothetical protein [Streptosporangiaceae bacterium]
MNGPYETEAEAREAARPIYDQLHTAVLAASGERRTGLMTSLNHRLLVAACGDVGVHLGAYDQRFLSWMSNWEPELCVVLAGIIRRAGETMTPVLEDPALAIARAMTDEQRRTIVERFTKLNPHWQGAEAADILDTLDQADSNLEETEPFWEANPGLAKRPGAGVAALALLWSGETLSPEAVAGLLASVGVRRA